MNAPNIGLFVFSFLTHEPGAEHLMLSLNLIGTSQSGMSLQTLQEVGKSANPGANCPPLAYFILSIHLKIEKPGVETQTA